jgi:hypothetical protein
MSYSDASLGRGLIALGFTIGSVGLIDLSAGKVHGRRVIRLARICVFGGSVVFIAPAIELLTRATLDDVGLGFASCGLGLMGVARGLWLSEGLR